MDIFNITVVVILAVSLLTVNVLAFIFVPVDTVKWVMDDICNILEEHPEYENMSDEELTQKRVILYLEAQDYYDRGSRLESDGDTIGQYIRIRKEMDERR